MKYLILLVNFELRNKLWGMSENYITCDNSFFVGKGSFHGGPVIKFTKIQKFSVCHSFGFYFSKNKSITMKFQYAVTLVMFTLFTKMHYCAVHTFFGGTRYHLLFPLNIPKIYKIYVNFIKIDQKIVYISIFIFHQKFDSYTNFM